MVTLTVLKFAPGDRYRAFANIGRWMMKPFDAPGLQFQKMMGTGKNFGLWPDFSQYVFLGTWASEADALRFFASDTWRPFLPNEPDEVNVPTPDAPTHGAGTLFLEPFKSHGQWDGMNPFEATGAPTQTPSSALPVAVLTRATIRTSKLFDFWRNVPAARQRLTEQGDKLLLAIGSGEVPLVQQCTLSVWRDAATVDQFAYRQSGHKEIVKKTRQRNWYTEELFARFWVVRAEGSLGSVIANRNG
ncbi:DUF3291 domain-containing protein [Fibrella sp. WM1]|uniref:DUF3291 domain-containing protein n=1 Tax=Fibrella musci TaxID=3242485 RepID=UPI0035208524